MKITKEQLRKMIKEEINEVVVMAGPEYEAVEALVASAVEEHGAEKAAAILSMAARKAGSVGVQASRFEHRDENS